MILSIVWIASKLTNHEVLILARMVQVGSVRKYDHILRAEYFTGFNADIYGALRSYEAQYGVCMDRATFCHQFPEFPWVEDNVQIEWYADELKQAFTLHKVGKYLHDTSEALEANPIAVTNELITNLTNLVPYISNAIIGQTEVVGHRQQRSQKFKADRIHEESFVGITTGFPLLDKYFNGTQSGEIELYVARPGNGKSLILLYGCYKAWQQGKRVSFVSPEMSAYEMGIRFDSMSTHMSSMRMYSGNMTDDEIEVYDNFTESMLDEMRHDIIFYDSERLGRKFTTGDIRRIIETDKPEIIAIDGILLLEPNAKYKDTRNRVINIMDELKEIVVQTKVPMRLAHQANRESEQRGASKKKDRTPMDAIPQLHELAESGSTEQYANRVICMRLEGKRLYYAIRKNRRGPFDRFMSVDFDIDTGTVSDEREEIPGETKTATVFSADELEDGF